MSDVNFVVRYCGVSGKYAVKFGDAWSQPMALEHLANVINHWAPKAAVGSVANREVLVKRYAFSSTTFRKAPQVSASVELTLADLGLA
jgi:hypothetical protein